jgi:hypothetical protein
MSMQLSLRDTWALVALVLLTTVAMGQERLVIDVSKAQRTRSSSSAVHYQPTASVRHSEQRSYEAAQTRHSVRDAQSRREVQGAQTRRTADASGRREVQEAESRSFSGATDRHGSVRLDTIR